MVHIPVYKFATCNAYIGQREERTYDNFSKSWQLEENIIENGVMIYLKA